jgi:hypothetical protein
MDWRPPQQARIALLATVWEQRLTRCDVEKIRGE